ncbi:MAG: tetratricopeptide repeat protein [Verrucomicrobiota bacterium]
MRRFRRWLASAVLGLAWWLPGGGGLYAVTWEEVRVKDPLSGYEITVRQPRDLTGDIYSWPSRRDLVYFPYTDAHYIWHSPHTDYVSFANDFHELNEEEKRRIRRYLKRNRLYVGEEISIEQKLARLEAIYRLRDKDEAFWRWFYRVMAHWHRDRPEKARGYHAKLVPILERQLAEVDDGVERIKTLYLLGEYSWRLDRREEAQKYFSRARRIVWTDQKGQARTGIGYVNDMIEQRLFDLLAEEAKKREEAKKQRTNAQKK